MLTIYHDPLAFIAPTLPEFVTRGLAYIGFEALGPHLHEIVIAALFYTIVYKTTQVVSPVLAPQYTYLKTRNQINFDLHIVSQIQAPLICLLSFPLFFDADLNSATAATPYSMFVVSSCIGYFIWDLWVCLKYRKMFGMGFVAHALAALVTFTCCGLPMLHNFAAPFIWFEASTPFVNIHWFAGHVQGMISDRLKTINGLILLLTFFLARIVSGPYNGILLFRELYYHYPENCPVWMMTIVLSCFFTLTSLNFVWFSKMIQTATKMLGKTKAD